MLVPWLVAAAPVALPVSVRVDDSRDALAAGTAHVVGGMLAYTRWPPDARGHSGTPGVNGGPPIRLCIVGPTLHAARFNGMNLPGGRRVSSVNLPTNAPSLSGDCDVVYIGAMALPTMRQITARLRGAPVLTIAEADPLCRSEAMFCLLFAPRAISFQLNIDAVSRSLVTVDPRVLRLARGF